MTPTKDVIVTAVRRRLAIWILVCATSGAVTASATSQTPDPGATTPTKAPPPGFNPECSYRQGRALPDPVCTPGATFTKLTIKRLCRAGYVRRANHVSASVRSGLFFAYSVFDSREPGAYQIDHLVPLELGGSNARTNLWPQPRKSDEGHGYRDKDVLEKRLQERVCSGRTLLRAAQAAIRADWLKAAERYLN